MARLTRMKCDRCFKEYDFYFDSKEYNAVTLTQRSSNERSPDTVFETFDLCPECRDEFDVFMNGRPEDEE